MENNKELIISEGRSRKETNWKPVKIFWSEFVERLKKPVRSTETLQEYKALPKARQDDLKDVGGFVGGTLKGCRRKNGNAAERYLVTLDLDSIPAGRTDDILRRVDGLGCAYVVYSTRKHEEAAPRLRVVVPSNRPMTPDEYQPASRKLAALIGIDFCDPTTFDVLRLMYWPSVCDQADYVYSFGDKPFLNVDGMLGMYGDWRNAAEWPQVPGEDNIINRSLKRQQNPTEKDGVIGAFCRVYDVPAAIAAFIPDVYAETATPGRYTFTGGSTAAGAVLYDNGLFLYSHHATDPAGGKLSNAFDLIRIHKFGYLDEDAKPDTPTPKLPSSAAMREFALQDEAVHKKYLEEIFEAPEGEDLSKFHKLKKGVPVGVFDDAIVKDILDKHEFFLMGNSFYVYDNGVYREDREELTVKGWIQEHIYPNFITARVINSIYHLLSFQKERQKSYSELNAYPDTWINFRNGMFDVGGWKLHPHNPEYYSINQVPHDFTGRQPGTTGAVEQFLNEAIGSKDNITMLLQYVGYCFTKGVEFEKFMILYGTGGTGKSVLIKLILEAVGQCNASSISLQKLNERFYAIELMGKLINACADIPGDVMKSVDIIKQLVSGDSMSGERKGKDPISFQNTAKLLFSGNALPLNLDEATNAFYRRIIILKMDKPPRNADPELIDKLIQDIDYFIYRAVQEFSFAYMLGAITESDSSRAEVKKLYKYSDTVAAFLDDCTVRCLGARVERGALYNAYQAYCYEEERTPLTRNKFYKNLEESKKICPRKSHGARVFEDIELVRGASE